MGQLDLGHLEREEGDGQALPAGDVVGDVADERRLSQRGAGGEDDQVAGLEAAEQAVEVAEPRRGAGQLAVAAGERLEAVDLLGEDVGDLAEVAGPVLVGDLEQERLGLLDQLAGLALALVDGLLDPVRGVQQAAQERVLLDDPRVVAGVAGGRDGAGELR